MKVLKVIGEKGVIVGQWVVNVKGDDFVSSFPYPVYYPIVAISLLEKRGRKSKAEHRQEG